MHIEYEDNVSPQKHETFIRQSEVSYFFHTPSWIAILKKAYKYQNASRIYYCDGAEILVPMVKEKKWGFSLYHSIPFGYGGMFPFDVLTPERVGQIIENLITAHDLYFDLSLPPLAHLPVPPRLQRFQALSEYNFTHMIFVNGSSDSIVKKHRSFKRSIKQAEKNNILTSTAENMQEIKQCYDLYLDTARPWGYYNPPISWELFSCMFENRSDNIQFHVAWLQKEIIGVVVTLEYMRTIFIFMNAQNRLYRDLCPIHLIVKTVLEEAYEKGIPYVNLGASGNLKGVGEFKECIGGKKVNLERYKFYSPLAESLKKISSFFIS